MTRKKRVSVVEEPAILARLRRVEQWRRARLQRLLGQSPRAREQAIRAGRLYLEVSTRCMAAERGLIKL